MRRISVLFVAVAALSAALPPLAHAQSRREQQAPQTDEADDKRRQQDKEWGDVRAPLPQMRNAGPCPFVKILYDAARYQEFKEGREAASAVGFTGEVQGVSAMCEYKDSDPIKVKMEVLFELGKGPSAEGDSKTYRYWVAVTQRNQMPIAKETFDLPVKFAPGAERVYARESIENIEIPRATMTTSGANFEILVGFEVTPQMAAFNRDGKRFRLNAGAASVATSGGAAAKP
jgi:hypothetical protein